MAGGERRFRRAGGRLVVDGTPSIIAPRVLPGQRLLRLRLRNAGDVATELRRAEVRLLDGEGTDLRAHCTPPELAVAPGATETLDFVYRAREGTGVPACLEHAGGVVELAPAATSARRA